GPSRRTADVVARRERGRRRRAREGVVERCWSTTAAAAVPSALASAVQVAGRARLSGRGPGAGPSAISLIRAVSGERSRTRPKGRGTRRRAVAKAGPSHGG